MLDQRRASKELPSGLDSLWDRAVGVVRRAMISHKSFLARAKRILAIEADIADQADAKLRELAQDLRAVFRCGKDTPGDLNRAVALVREVAFRQIGLKAFAVQVAGALALEAGCIVEMATGEGKTVTATIPAAIAGWRGKGCHIITANDYLAGRDAQDMGPIYRFCGLTVASIDPEMAPAGRREAYLADITYTTNKEASADFLRDRLALGKLTGLSETLLAKIVDGTGRGTDRLVQRGLNYAIVDEADSILIDEAITPLIISGEAPNPQQVEAFHEGAQLAGLLSLGSDYRVNQRYREVELTPSGKRRLAELGKEMGGMWHGKRRREEMVTQALTAGELYRQGKQYVVQEDKVVIVDEFTGRLMPDREWRDGLHQAVTAKEGLEVQPPKDTYARISFQRFFRMYRQLSGMTGTAAEAAAEFWQVYHLPIVVIPTNRPCIRQVLKDRVFATQQAKWRAIVAEIRRLNATGRPVLVGTRSVRASELLSELLTAEGMDHQVLNAVRHAEEAQIVAGAGKAGRVTVATNMAGRGTDIKLGPGVAEAGGLHVIASERHEAGRIDRQLFGRSARQGDPGSAQAFVALQDELLARHAPHVGGVLRKWSGQTDREVSSPITRGIFNLAQKRAQRMALRQRKSVLKTDDWLNEYLGFAGTEV